MSEPQRSATRWPWLATLPVTQLKFLSTQLMNWATAFVVFYIMVTKITPPEFAYNAWLIFLGGLNGFALGQWIGKRMTDTEYQTAKTGAQQPSPINVQAPVNVQAPNTITIEQPVPQTEPIPPQPLAAPPRQKDD